MPLHLPPAHRVARINYPNRSGWFAFSFLALLAFMAERGYSAGMLIFGIVSLLIYPQLAYLHARIAMDSKRAEFRNLVVDSILVGVWAAQVHFALWPVCAALTGVSMDNAVCGGVRRFFSGLLYAAAAAALWAIVQGVPFEPSTGPIVTGLCFFAIVGYVVGLGVFFHDQNSSLVRTRNVLRSSEEQFRFIAEHAGDLVSVLTPEYRFRYASPSHGKYFEAAKFADSVNWLDLVYPEDRVRARVFLDSLGKSPNSGRTHLRMSFGGLPRVIECEGNPVREPGGKLQMIVLLCRELIVGDQAEAAGPRDDAAAGSGVPNPAGN